MELPPIAEATRLRMEPGDTLAVTVTENIDREMAEEIVREVRRVMGEDTRVLVLAPGISLAVLTQEGNDSADEGTGWHNEFGYGQP